MKIIKKTYKFKFGNKIVHNDTKEIKKIVRINTRDDTYQFGQEGTRTLESVSQEEIEENYSIYTLGNIWDNL